MFAAQRNYDLISLDVRGFEHLEGLLEIFKPWLEILVLQQVADECGVFAAMVARALVVMELLAIYNLFWSLHVLVPLLER